MIRSSASSCCGGFASVWFSTSIVVPCASNTFFNVSKPNLVSLSSYNTTTLSTSLCSTRSRSLRKPLLFSFKPEPISVTTSRTPLCLKYSTCLSKSSFCVLEETLAYPITLRMPFSPCNLLISDSGILLRPPGVLTTLILPCLSHF